MFMQENIVETAEDDTQVEKNTVDVDKKLGIDSFNEEERDHKKERKKKKTHDMSEYHLLFIYSDIVSIVGIWYCSLFLLICI